jgi:hypothetical protein
MYTGWREGWIPDRDVQCTQSRERAGFQVERHTECRVVWLPDRDVLIVQCTQSGEIAGFQVGMFVQKVNRKEGWLPAN